jgi:magnesium-transporting ATPase (P-type)
MLVLKYAPQGEVLAYAILAWGLMIFHLASAYGRQLRRAETEPDCELARRFGLKTYISYWSVSLIVFLMTLFLPQLSFHPINRLFDAMCCYLMDLQIVNYILIAFSTWVMLWNVRYGTRGLLGIFRFSLRR